MNRFGITVPVQNKPALDPGKAADFVLLDADWNVKAVYIEGEPVF